MFSFFIYAVVVRPATSTLEPEQSLTKSLPRVEGAENPTATVEGWLMTWTYLELPSNMQVTFPRDFYSFVKYRPDIAN